MGHLPILLGAALVIASPAFADDAPAPFGGMTTSAAATQAFASILTSCLPLQQIQAVISNSAGKAPPVTINSKCSEAKMPDLATQPQCEDFYVDGAFKADPLNDLLKTIDAAEEGVTCRRARFEAVKGEISCLQAQGKELAHVVASLQQEYSANIALANKQVTEAMTQEADMQAQFGDALLKLNGRDEAGGNGRTGLLKLRDATKAVVDEIGQTTLEVKDMQKAIALQRQQFNEGMQQKTMAMTTECFAQRPDAKYRSTANHDPQTAMDYFLDRYEQQQLISPSGKVLRDDVSRAKAKAARGRLENLLRQMLTDAPASSKPPKDQAEAIAQANSQIDILSIADIEKVYGSQLKEFDNSGLNMKSAIMKALGSCFQRSDRIVKNERKRKGTPMAQAEEGILKTERAATQRANDLMTKYARQYADDMRGLTGANLPLNLSACMGAKPETQANCLDTLKTNMEGMLTGTTASAQMKMVIKGNIPANNVVFNCDGLEGCITKLQNATENLQKNIGMKQAERKKYTDSANTFIQQRTKSLASMFSQQSQMMNDRINELSMALSELTGQSGFKVGPVSPASLEYDDKTGLVKDPANLIGLIGGGMTPPMPDLASGALSEATGQIGTGLKDIQKEQTDIATAKRNLAALANTCPAKDIKAKAKLAADNSKAALDAALAANCGYQDHYCKDSDGDELALLTSSVNAAISNVAQKAAGFDASDLRALTGVLAHICKTPPFELTTVCAKDDVPCQSEQARLKRLRADAVESPSCISVFSTVKGELHKIGPNGDLGSSSSGAK